MPLSLQGKPPTKKATVLNKVNKTLLAPAGPDGEGTEHTQEKKKKRVLKHCTKSYFTCVTPLFCHPIGAAAGFEWGAYLEKETSLAASVSCFRHVSPVCQV